MGRWLVCVLLLSADARAQVGDPPPPPAPIEDPADAPEPAPAPVAPEEPPAARPPPARGSEGDTVGDKRLPAPDPPSEPPRPAPGPPHPAAAAGLGALGGAAGLLAGSTAALGFLFSLQANETANSELSTFLGAVLAVSTVPFLAAAGAGLLLLPFGNPAGPWQYAKLCLACGAMYVMAWLCVIAGGAGLLGVGLGCNPGGCNPGGGWGSCGDGCGNPFADHDAPDEPLRRDVYGAAIGAGAGTILGAAAGYFLVGWTETELGEIPPPELLFLAAGAGGALVGAAAGGALGGLTGAMSWRDDLEDAAE